MLIRPMRENDIAAVKAFTDKAIGENYYRLFELEEILKKSTHSGHVFTLLLEDSHHQIRGIRITYPPGQWKKGKGQGLSPEKWHLPFEKVAYFQSLFIDPSITAQGWGKKMSLEAIRMLKEIGTYAIVTHSWKESPHDSSGRYLRSLGFQLVATHPLYWKEVDYTCTRCGKPCLCTAEEMLLDLKKL